MSRLAWQRDADNVTFPLILACLEDIRERDITPIPLSHPVTGAPPLQIRKVAVSLFDGGCGAADVLSWQTPREGDLP